ncbi:putative transcription factor C2H2 family [Helianthus annuus]|nr:putative transcription factor C2H2 family [Helianthus annuus]
MWVRPCTAPSPTDNQPESHHRLYLVGFFLAVFLLITITYASCKFKDSRIPLPSTTIYENNTIPLSRGLDDDIIESFPTFHYITAPHNVDTTIDANSSSCSICLEGYEPLDIVRILPKCGHFFHVGCTDTWLKANPTCPVCRVLITRCVGTLSVSV